MPVGLTLLKNARVAQSAVGNGTSGGTDRDWAKTAPLEYCHPVRV